MSSLSLGSLTQLAPLVIIFGLFYMLLIRPQQTRAKELRTQLAAVKRGDRVVTGGGILATVAKTREGSNEIEVDIAANVRVVVLRETLTAVVAPAAQSTEGRVQTADKS